MTETKYLCDHCGKELNLQKDYDDIGIEVSGTYIAADLCSDCKEGLVALIKNFISRE